MLIYKQKHMNNIYLHIIYMVFLVAQTVKNPPSMWET